MSQPSATSPLAALVRRGVGVVFAAQVGSQLVSIGAFACLTRLVDEKAFGVIGVALPLVMLPRMAASLGFGTSATVTQEDDLPLLSALFWRTLLWSITAAILTAILGWLFADIYAMPPLRQVAAVLGLATVFNALSVVHLAVLERRLQLTRASLIRVVSQVTAAVAAVAAAWQGWQVWSLVLQHTLELALLAPLSWLASRWVPSIAHRHLPPEARKLGGYYALATLAFYAAQNVDKLLLAAWLGSSPSGQAILGMYTQAYNLMMRPVYFVTTPIWSVMLPTLARAEQNDSARDDWTQRFFRLTSLLLFPAGVGLWLLSHDVMQALAPKWEHGGDFLQAFSPLVIAQGLINITGSLLVSIRRTGLLCFAALVQLVLLVQAAMLGASFATSDYEFTASAFVREEAQFHLALGTAYGVMLATCLAIFIPYILFVCYIARVSAGRSLQATLGPLLAALVMGLAVHLARRWLLLDQEPAVCLVVSVVVGAVVYLAAAYPVWKSHLHSRSPDSAGL